MLKWILILVVVAIVAGALGYRGVASGASRLALVLAAAFIVFVVVVLLLFAWAGGGLI
jgi:uncharacterized membrane protein YtjA (UPF0391 family)